MPEGYYSGDDKQVSPGNRARDPKALKGVRARLRTFLRSAGVLGKIRTDFHRHPKLHLYVEVETEAMKALVEETCSSFETYDVRVFR